MTMTPDDVLTFWFEEAGPDKWFEKSDDFDAEIADRFGALTHAARDGKLVTWLETPRGCLALIILIDQFSRNIHRDSPLAWSADAHALALTRLALDKQFDEQPRTERAQIPLYAAHAQRGSERSGAVCGGVREAGRGRCRGRRDKSRLRRATPRHHCPVRAFPPSQRNSGAREQRRGARVSGGTKLFVLTRFCPARAGPPIRTRHHPLPRCGFPAPRQSQRRPARPHSCR